MTRRTFVITAGAAALAGLMPFQVSTQKAAAPPLVITAYNGGAPIPYTPPKTPWGEPDLQGVWSSDDTAGIPRERDAKVGARPYQTDEEWAARQKQVSDGIRRGENGARPAIAARSATAPSTPSRTSRSTTAASRAASSARCCG